MDNNPNKTNTLLDVKNYTFTKGMNVDASPEAQPQDTYRAALNIVKESSEGDENFLTSEYSNSFRMQLPGKVLHHNLIKQLDKFVVFLHTNEIGVYDPNLNTYTPLYSDPELDFSIYLESVSFTKTECEDIVLVFWDGKNRVRNINVTKYLKEGPGSGNVEDLELFKTAETCVNLVDVKFVDNAAYNVDAGVYRPFIQYEDEDGNTTNYYIINENIPLIEDSTSGSYQYIDGNPSKILNKSIVLLLENLDTKYPYMNVGFIKTVNGVSTSFIFKKLQPVADKLTITYEGDTTFNQTVDLAEILNKRAFYVSAKHGLVYNNKLLLAGLKGIKKIDYQHYVNDITVKYVTGKINLSKTKGYKNPEHIIHHKSWMRDENYMIGIVLEFEDMTESAVFPLINKKYSDFPDWNTDNPQTEDTVLGCTDDRAYWREVNTAKRLNYNEFATDLSVTDFCSGTIDTEGNNIRSEGYLGYFESEERYPIIPRCGTNTGSLIPEDYMYPTEVISGKLYGKKITLFKMPDSTIEPFHNNLTDEYAIEDNKNRFDSKYDSLEIYPLGIKLEGVKMPSLDETGGVKVTGYRVVYVRRDSFNKSVQDKGWFVEMFKNKFNGQEYIYPKHNVNAGAKWDYFSNLRDTSIETKNPVQDYVHSCGYGKHYDNGIMFYGGNTMFSQQGLNVNHIKIEQQYSTIGYYIDSVNQINTTPGGSIGSGVIDPSTFKDKDGRLRSTAIQIYNFYDYGYKQNTDVTIDRSKGYKNRSLHYNFKNISTDNYSYVNDNVILNKILNSDYSLVNFYRESGVYLDYRSKSDLSFNKNFQFFNSDTSSKKCNVVLPSITYFKDYLDNTTAPNILDRSNNGYIYYGAIKNHLPRQYGSIDDMVFIDTGLKACAGSETLTGFYGDSYINTFSFVRTGVTGMLEDSYIDDDSAAWMDRGDPTYTIEEIIGTNNRSYLLNLYLAQKANVTLINTVTESDVNLDLRYEGPNFNEVYFPKLSNGKYNLFSKRKNEYAEDCFLNSYFYELICRNADDNCTSTNYDQVEYNDAYKNFHNNKINLNNDYNELNGMRFNFFKPINKNYKTCDCDTEYDNRIAISATDNQAVGRLNYNKFLKNSFITIPHKEGKITHLFKESQVLYAHTTDNIWKLLTLESKLQADNSLVYLGTNDFLSAQQLELFASNEGYMGLQDKRFKFQNNTGYFFTDLKNQTLNLMSGGKLDAVSTYGMNSFFKEEWNSHFNSYGRDTNTSLPIIPRQNPDLSSVEIYFGYDYRHKRLLLTDKTNDFTISYYPEDKAFYSFHSYIPMAYMQNRDTFFTQDDNYNLYIHEDNFNSYRIFNGVNYPSLVDGVFTYHPLLYTVLNNVGIKIDAYKNVRGQLLLVNEPPTSLQVWTNRQHSGEIFLKTPVDKDYMKNVVMSNEPHSIINGIVYCNHLANYVLDHTDNFVDEGLFPTPNANVSFAKDWTQVDRLEHNFFNYRIKIDNKDLENLKFILKFTVLNYNISMR